jgi:hypothetical protein
MQSGQALAGVVQPIRASVPSRVERGTLKVRQTDALLAPPSSAAVIRSRVSASIIGGRPPWRPRRLAAASPATTRSRVSARSYCANAPNSENSNSPWGVVVSICSVRDRNAIPRAFRSVTIVSRWGSERPSRSSFQTISVSPALNSRGTLSAPADRRAPRMPCRYGDADDRRQLRPARRAEDRPFGDHRPTTPACIPPACTTNPQKHVLAHSTNATGFVERYGTKQRTARSNSTAGVS